MALTPLKQKAVDAMVETIPAVLDQLQAAHRVSPLPGTIIVYHDAARAAIYGFRTLDDKPWFPKREHRLSAKNLLQPLWRMYERRQSYRRGVQRLPSVPHFYLAIDLQSEHAWYRHKFDALVNVRREDRIDARTLGPARCAPAHTPPEVTVRGEKVGPVEAAPVSDLLGSLADRPEEVFLLGEELLTLAVDTLAYGALDPSERMDPLPVHKNAAWVFERPVKAMRPDGRERHLRALWYREGEAVWRLRAYVGSLREGRREPIRQSGKQLAGRIPFSPRLDAGYPEQMLLAAIWSLMAQGGVTDTSLESRPEVTQAASLSALGPEPLRIVRLKAGTEHERLYRGAGVGQSLVARGA